MRVLDGDAQNPLTNNPVKPMATLQTDESSKDGMNETASLIVTPVPD